MCVLNYLYFQSMVVGLLDYQKLEKIEAGGFIGRWLSPTIDDIHFRFSKYVEKAASISYDAMDFSNEENNTLFLEDYNFYLDVSNDIDNRLANIVKASFENSDDLMSVHKVNYVSFDFNDFVNHMVTNMHVPDDFFLNEIHFFFF